MTADVTPTSANADAGMGLGVEIRLIPGHCDQTVNLYDWYVCVRGTRVEQIWPSPRGCAVSRFPTQITR